LIRRISQNLPEVITSVKKKISSYRESFTKEEKELPKSINNLNDNQTFISHKKHLSDLSSD